MITLTNQFSNMKYNSFLKLSTDKNSIFRRTRLFHQSNAKTHLQPNDTKSDNKGAVS